MTEVWKSNENRFCKYCKCWVADNKVSWAGHEQGVRHKKAVDEKLSEMKRKAVSDQKSAKDEAHWLRKMEEAALKDYKSKDISSNRYIVYLISLLLDNLLSVGILLLSYITTRICLM